MSNTAPKLRKLLISAREAASHLSICERTLFEETKAGRIPSIRVRKRVLYRVEALEKWAEQNEQGPKS